MKRIIAIMIILAALLPAVVNAQSATPLPSITPPWPIAPTHFVKFGPAAENLVTQEGVDFVTVGSLMPYRVNPPVLEGDMPTGANTNFSIDYKWQFMSGTAVLPVLRMPVDASGVPNPGAAPAATSNPVLHWYTTNEVSVKMPTTVGTVALTNNSRLVFNGTVMCDEAPGTNDLNYTIRVVPRPSIKINTADGIGVGDLEMISCVEDPVTFPTNSDEGALLIVDGYDVINVQFTLKRRPLGGGDATTVVNAQWIELTGKELTFPGAMFTQVGVYTIDILNVTDRISRKSLDQDAVKAVADVDMPPAGSMNVYIYPKPNSSGNVQDVEHIKNN